MFRLSYNIIGLSSLNIAGRRLAGLAFFGPLVWAGYGPETYGPGPNIHGLGWAWTLTANCGLGLGSNYKPAQGTNRQTKCSIASPLTWSSVKVLRIAYMFQGSRQGWHVTK